MTYQLLVESNNIRYDSVKYTYHSALDMHLTTHECECTQHADIYQYQTLNSRIATMIVFLKLYIVQ